jgi:hypothetical protein
MVAPHGNGTTAFGCCSAHVDLYNVYDATGSADKTAIARALMDSAKRNVVVVNMSFTLNTVPDFLDAAIQACVAKGILLVASMGGIAAPDAVFPAKHSSVLAIGGTTATDDRHNQSLTGDYMFLAAPAENMQTFNGPWNGTSFAAPMVTAAIWLARRRRPDLSADEIKKVLARSGVNPKNLKQSEIGAGRLDMTKLAAQLLAHAKASK